MERLSSVAVWSFACSRRQLSAGQVSVSGQETTLYTFQNFEDGVNSSFGALSFDNAGNIYGTTQYGGHPATCQQEGCGVVYELTRNGGAWTENAVYTFTGINDGGDPVSGVILDQQGNLYGTTPKGHDNGQYGVV